MRTFLLITVWLYCHSCLAWQVIHETDSLKVWKSSKYSDVYLSEKIIKKPSSLFNKLGEFNLAEANMKKRAFLSLLGVGHWTITDKSVDPKKNTLSFTGNYLDREKKLNHFLEVHRYEKNRSTQVLVTSIVGNISLDDILADFESREAKP